MVGYFGGYISKKQKVGRFELKQSIAAQPYFYKKLRGKQHENARSQLAHVCNRMFCQLEGKGVLRTGVEECLLASEYLPHDELAAEFLRTFRHTFFFGKAYLDRHEQTRSTEEAASKVQQHNCKNVAMVVWALETNPSTSQATPDLGALRAEKYN